MSKEKKVSISAVDNVLKEKFSNEGVFNWFGISVSFKESLNLEDMLNFVSGVVDSCFNDDDGSYHPEIKDFAIRANIVEIYTNVTLPKNAEHKYEIVYETNLVDEIYTHINKAQFKEMIAAIDKKIDNAAAASIQYVYKQMNEATSSISSAIEIIKELFDGISADDIQNLIKAMSENNGFDEAKLLEAYIASTKEDDK